MDRDALKDRTKAFALRVMRLVDQLPRSVKGRCIADQLTRSASSVAANYRAACRARSKAEFVSKLSTVVEESDESMLWIELTAEGTSPDAEADQQLVPFLEDSAFPDYGAVGIPARPLVARLLCYSYGGTGSDGAGGPPEGDWADFSP